LSEKNASLVADLERLPGEDERGDPESPLRWTAKSVRYLADASKWNKIEHRLFSFISQDGTTYLPTPTKPPA